MDEKVSVIVPTLNEVGSVGNVLKDLSRQEIDEILVVDGHSTDGTIDLVKDLGFRVKFQDEKGLGKAVKTGINSTSGEIIIVIDADSSFEISDIPKFIAKISEGYDLVVGSRYTGCPTIRGLFRFHGSSSYDDTLIRELGNRIFTFLCRKLYGLKVHDVLFGFKAFRRSMLESLDLIEAGQQYDVEIMIKAKKAGFKVTEVPTVEYKRTYGKSKLSVPYHGFKILWVILRELFI